MDSDAHLLVRVEWRAGSTSKSPDERQRERADLTLAQAVLAAYELELVDGQPRELLLVRLAAFEQTRPLLPLDVGRLGVHCRHFVPAASLDLSRSTRV